MKFISLILIFAGISTASFSQEMWTIGPAIHLNFAKQERVKLSFALEGAYWNLNDFYHSVDAGLEFERSKIRFYSELQTGFKMGGISCGPVIEFTTNKKGTHLGLQSSVWTNYYISTDFRMRWIDGKTFKACGIFSPAKFSTTFPDVDQTWIGKKVEAFNKRTDEDKNSSNTDYSNSHTSSGSWWDWD